MSFGDDVRKIILSIPEGRVMSYGDVAAAAGSPRAARGVAQILRRSDDLPWYRVLRYDGSCAEHISALQRVLLEEEGVLFDACGRAEKHFFYYPGQR